MKNRMAIGRKNQYLLVLVFILTGMTFYLFGIREDSMTKQNIKLYKFKENIPLPGFIVHTPGCRIPEMDPFDISIQKYLQKINSTQCSDKPPLIESNQTAIWVVEEALESYNVSDLSEFGCCYSSFWRKAVDFKNIDRDADNLISEKETCIPFNSSVNIYNEFIEVICILDGVEIYRDYHAFIVPKNKNNTSNEENFERLSVLIIGADTLSRLNFYRQMPRTKDLIHSLGAYEFFGYNKVHDNTFPNLVPMLSGLSVKEISDFCWLNDSFFDDCPWIWKNFSAKNYFTAFGEDACWIGLFNYQKKGFFQPPTDYYIRPYMQTNERRIGHLRPANTEYCVGARLTAEVLLDYAYKFSVNMTSSDKKFWAFFWESSLTHDFLNVDSINDKTFFNFFKKLQEKNLLNKTAVFFMSDHGMRWGPIRETYQGRMEEHLPFLYIILPNWFKSKYKLAVFNLKQNAHLLTTHYDVFQTMKDLLNLEDIERENLERRSLQIGNSRGVSLFLPISIYRTCLSAGIEPTWCTCQRSKLVSEKNKNVQRAAKVIIDFLNKLLIKYKECATLKLERIISARLELAEDFIKKNTINQFTDYIVTITTTPGFAKFEAIVRHLSNKDDMKVLGEISRINLYGSQSKCVSDYRLKLYCFCL